MKYAIEFIAGGVVKDADGNIVDDTSQKAAEQKLAGLNLPNLLEQENDQ